MCVPQNYSLLALHYLHLFLALVELSPELVDELGGITGADLVGADAVQKEGHMISEGGRCGRLLLLFLGGR